MTLRSYQTEGIGDILLAFAAGFRRVLYVLPTGGGKTVLFDDLMLNWHGSALAVAHRRELIRQASRQLGDTSHGIISPWFKANNERIQIGSIQTLARRTVRPFNLVVLDECHHCVAGTWKRFLDSQPDAFVLGLTATPERLDGRGLGEFFDCMIIGPSTADLIRMGYLKPWRGFAPPSSVKFEAMRTLGGDFNPRDVVEAMDKPDLIGDAVAHYAKHTPGQPALAFCASVAAAEHEAAGFRAGGWRATHVDGSLEQHDRDDRLQGLAEGYYDVITSCDLVSEGLDVPSISSVILRRPTQSLGRYLQMVGRGFRVGGADVLTILDHAGNMHRHGFPDDEREWSLEGRKKKTSTRPAVRTCPVCYACHRPGPVCPGCGYEYPKNTRIESLTAAEGDLVEVSRQPRGEGWVPGRTLADELADAHTWADIEAIRKARGYKPGWSRYVYRNKPNVRSETNSALTDFAAVIQELQPLGMR